MPRTTLEERVPALERQLAALLVVPAAGTVQDWRRTRGAFTGDNLMKQVFEEGGKIREAERKLALSRTRKQPRARS